MFEALGYAAVVITGTEKTFTQKTFLDLLNKFKRRSAILEVKSFAVFLGGHGYDGVLEMSDGSFINLETDVFSTLCSPPQKYDEALGAGVWNSIPKMFFIQACRSDPEDKPPEITNCLISYACESKKPAHRSDTSGSYYVEALTEVLAGNASGMDLCKMLDLVSTDLIIISEQCYILLWT